MYDRVTIDWRKYEQRTHNTHISRIILIAQQREVESYAQTHAAVQLCMRRREVPVSERDFSISYISCVEPPGCVFRKSVTS